MFQTRVRVLFLAVACFPAKFFCIFRNNSRNKKVMTAWFKQAAAYFLTHFLLFIFFLVIKYNSGDINLVPEIIIKLMKIFDFWSNHIVHADMSDQLIIMEGDCYQNDKYSKVRTILRIVFFLINRYLIRLARTWRNSGQDKKL